MFKLTEINVPQPDLSNVFDEIADSNPLLVENIFRELRKEIEEFQNNLGDDEEPAMWFTNFGQSVLMSVTNVAFKSPSLICFSGFVNGNRSRIIQHMNQLNFLITTIKKENSNKPAVKIGFQSDMD